MFTVVSADIMDTFAEQEEAKRELVTRVGESLGSEEVGEGGSEIEEVGEGGSELESANCEGEERGE